MGGLSLTCSKALLAFCNFLFLACGCMLVTGGLLILFDSGRILLSRLLLPGPFSTMPHPLLYYLSIGLTVLGLFIAGIGILGCWASCLQSYFMLSVYAFVIILLLVGECAIYTVSWVWPHCLGLDLNPMDLTKALQKSYGVAGEEQITAAIDLAQTTFRCCGINSANEYDMSLWRLQELGPNKLAVPLTCCILENVFEIGGYLNPQPLNVSLCQALETTRHEGFRYMHGCLDSLDHWYKQQYVVFLTVGLIIVLIEFAVLLCTILAFTTICKHKEAAKQEKKVQHITERIQIPKPSENIYQRNVLYPYNNDSFTMSNSFRQNYKLIDRI